MNPARIQRLLHDALANHKAGRSDMARDGYAAVRKAAPRNFDGYHLAGILELGQGRMDEAERLLRRAHRLDRQSTACEKKLAIVLLAKNNPVEAEKHLRAVLTRDRGDLEALTRLGEALRLQGRAGEAVSILRESAALHPDSAEVQNNLGLALKDSGSYEEAAACFRRSSDLNPKADAPHNNLGIVLKETGDLDRAIACYWKALELNPRSHLALNNLGNALKEKGDFLKAKTAFEKAIEITPTYAVAHNNLGTVFNELGDAASALAAFERAILLRPGYHHALSNRLLTLNYGGTLDGRSLIEEHLEVGRQFEAPFARGRRPHPNPRDPDRRLRIGYVSGDFRDHPVARFIEPVLSRHDRTQFEVFAYSNHRLEDGISADLKSVVDHWIPVWALNDEAMADRIRGDGIDILVDLSGHTAHNRLLVFARKPAPIQVSMIGYMQTTGLTSIDFRVTDHAIDPEADGGSSGSEKLLRLRHGAATYRPPECCPEVNPLPALSNGFITFGSFNNLAKATPEAIHAWVAILKRLPTARMLIVGRSGHSVGQIMQDQGIAADRLDLIDRLPLEGYLALHHRVDLLLDTFPYNGGTTNLNAIWMGVPFVSLAGSSTVARTGPSLLRVIGLEDLAATNKDDYIERAVAAASNLDQLSAWRPVLRLRVEPLLGDGTEFTRELETQLLAVWREWCATVGTASQKNGRHD
ncbi:MAG: tetratricopeptide repeat protein [Opitutaceae bacterium]